MERIDGVGIVGCGTMGSGIAELVARHGLRVVFIETDATTVDEGWGRIRRDLDRQVERGRLTDDERDAALARISGDTDWSRLGDCDLIIEAVPEDLELKQRTFERIDEVVRDDAILATNTSSLPVMDIAVRTRRPNRVLGFHFFNPAPVMKLIELVRTVVTDEHVLDAAAAFADRIGKVPVAVGDRRGFIANQLLFPYLNHAAAMVESGYATAEDIDAAMRYGAGLPMGPIALIDLVGVDTMLGIMEAIHGQFRDTRFAPRPVLRQLTAAGYLGRKSGRGFYRYDDGGDGGASTPPPSGDDPIAGWRTVGVVGSGTMATGIAEVCARAGFDVVVWARTKEKGEAAVARVARSLQRHVDKGRLTEEDMVATLARLRATGDLDDLADVDLVIEALAEELALKRTVLAALDAALQPDAVVTTTTSSLPVIDLAMATGRPGQVVGLHFFNPATIMRLVEIVPTVRTDAATERRARAFVDRVGKVAVRAPDRAGFIVNALLFPYLNDAVKMLASHYATAEQIDTAMKLGCGYPLGPFELMDIVGLDVTLAIVESLHAELREPSYEPAPLLRHLVEAHFLGRKAGRGFYVYD